MTQKALLKQAAAAVGLSCNALYWMARRGEVPHIRIGNRYVFDIQQLEEHLRTMALNNVKKSESNNVVQYGILRKVGL